jgi:hypothetical protein
MNLAGADRRVVHVRRDANHFSIAVLADVSHRDERTDRATALEDALR